MYYRALFLVPKEVYVHDIDVLCSTSSRCYSGFCVFDLVMIYFKIVFSVCPFFWIFWILVSMRQHISMTVDKNEEIFDLRFIYRCNYRIRKKDSKLNISVVIVALQLCSENVSVCKKKWDTLRVLRV